MTPTSPPTVIVPALLDVLLNASDALSVQALAQRLSKSPAEITRELERLRDAGCVLDAHPQLGYRLTQTGLGAWVDYLQWKLPPEVPPEVSPELPPEVSPQASPEVSPQAPPVEVYQQVGSTQDAARRMIRDRGEAADGGLVIAHEQTAGRGRLGRRWIAPPGGALTLSRACLGGAGVDRLTFLAAVACARVLERWTMSSGRGRGAVAIKWPNDLMIGPGKLGGILVESFRGRAGRAWSVLGIGVNLEPVAAGVVDRPVASLGDGGETPDRLAVLAALASELTGVLAQPDPAALLGEWRARCRTLHQEIHVFSGGRDMRGSFRGEVVDLDPDAGLILRDHAGTVHHLPAATTTVV